MSPYNSGEWHLTEEGLEGDGWQWWRDEMGHGYRLEGLEYGAAAAFGLMGMAEALHVKESRRHIRRLLDSFVSSDADQRKARIEAEEFLSR